MSERITFVHLTDLHIGNPFVEDDHLLSDTTTTLERILEEVKSLQPKPSFIIVSGDLTNRGDVGSYEELKRIMQNAQVDIPVLYALGNHDRRDGFYPSMLGRVDNIEEPYDHATVIDGIHVIVLDTSTAGRIGGFFEEGQLNWLSQQLAQNPETPKLLVMHHAPALDTDQADMEWESLSYNDTDLLRQVIEGRNVIGILSGHIHYDRVSHWYGVPVVVGVGQHAATDVLWLHEGLRMLEGSSFAIGTLRPSGLSITFAPQPATRHELHSFTYKDAAELFRRFDAE